ncbi:unnamed protein product [Brassica oleracea var. botrytis]
MVKLITFATMDKRQLHLMVHLPDVQHQPKNQVLWMRGTRRKHVWSESSMRTYTTTSSPYQIMLQHLSFSFKSISFFLNSM